MNMFCADVLKLLIILLRIYSGLAIINGPQDTTVCMNARPKFDCGFSGASPLSVVPNWRVILRSADSSIISNNTFNGLEIAFRHIRGLEWLPDLTSGYNNAPNSKLLVGPVNMTHNQSSYQCIITTVTSGSIISSLGTMTVMGKTIMYFDCSTYVIIIFHVTDPPSVIISVDKICTTSIMISLNT